MKSLILLVLLGGCVTRGEHAAFVEASRGFYDAVGPVFSQATTGDAGLSERSKRLRLELLHDYRLALEAAEERVR